MGGTGVKQAILYHAFEQWKLPRMPIDGGWCQCLSQSQQPRKGVS
ncbi:MAG: hypothetical protein AAB289_13890 [Chloroflexota bacterium]